jgi:hypothetical protein
MKAVRFFGTLGWLAFVAVAVAQSGCSALADLPAELPKVEAPDARDAYKTALAACLVCAVPDALPADAVKACEELAPVCDALAGVCK